MGKKETEKRFTQLDKRVKELDERLAKLEKAWKKTAKAVKETTTDKIAQTERTARPRERKSADK